MALHMYKSGEYFRQSHLQETIEFLPEEPRLEEDNKFVMDSMEVIVPDQNETSCDLDGNKSSCQTKCKAGVIASSNTKKAKRSKKFYWTSEKIEILLKYIKEYKTV